MSCPVNLQALPTGVFETVFTPETVRVGRSSVNSLSPLSFPASRCALWDGSPAGETIQLHLCSHRNPRLVLLEKALRLAQRHARHSNKPRLHCFLLGSLSVDEDEEGVTVTLDRFDPGRDGNGPEGSRVPSALLPGDVLVPCLFSTDDDTDALVQSEAELHHCFKLLHQTVSGRQTLAVSQLMRLVCHVTVTHPHGDAVSFSLRWLCVCPGVMAAVQPVRALPVIPTALMRSLTNANRPTTHTGTRQRGFVTMDQTRKLLLLLESDPKAASLPLVGLWLSGVTHVYSPQVWAWTLRFLFSCAIKDRVLSESGWFLLVLFGSTHRTPQFFQCRGTDTDMEYKMLTATQSVTLYQVAPVEGRSLCCDLSPGEQGRQTLVFTEAQSSFNRVSGPSVCDQDSGVDEDFSPRPSPSPHAPNMQTRRIQPSVPELSLLIDSSFTANQIAWPEPCPAPKPCPTLNTHHNSTNTPSTAPKQQPLQLHSTPNPNTQPPCACCATHTHECTSIFSSKSPRVQHTALQSAHTHTEPSVHNHSPNTHTEPSIHNHSPNTHTEPSVHNHSPNTRQNVIAVNSSNNQRTSPTSSKMKSPTPQQSSQKPSPPPEGCVQVPSDAYQLLLHQDRQLKLLQAQVQMLLEAQEQRSSRPVDTQKTTHSIAVGTGASLFWGDPVQQPMSCQSAQAPPPSPLSPASHRDIRTELADITARRDSGSSSNGMSGLQSPVLGESVSMYRPAEEQQSFYQNLMNQLTNRLQDCGQEVDEGAGPKRTGQSDTPNRSHSQSDAQDRSHSHQSHQTVSQTSQFSHTPSQCSQQASEHSQRSYSSSSSSSSSRSKQRHGERADSESDPVMSATLRQLQQLGVDVHQDLETDSGIQRTLENSSTLASIDPSLVLSRLSACEPSASCLLPGASVDLSLEANAIALRYLSDAQLSRLSPGRTGPAATSSSNDTLPSPSNMSLATRKYMRRYGLIEEEEEEEEMGLEAESIRLPLTPKLLPHSQLIRQTHTDRQTLTQTQTHTDRDTHRALRPKVQLLASRAKAGNNKENNSNPRRPSLVRAKQTEGSMGNILDLSRLRQLPKLF